MITFSHPAEGRGANFLSSPLNSDGSRAQRMGGGRGHTKPSRKHMKFPPRSLMRSSFIVPLLLASGTVVTLLNISSAQEQAPPAGAPPKSPPPGQAVPSSYDQISPALL